jgi:DNA ligase-1
LGRGQFDALSGLVRSSSGRDDDWHRVTYLVYEQPEGPGSFAQRLQALQALVARSAFEQLQVAPQDSLPDAAALQRRLAEVVAAGGEGLVLHRADAPYQVGRSDALLKLKPVQDADAVVVGHLPGQGKYQGRTGALKVRDAKGREFLIGSGLTDAQRGSPPPLGSTVSYRWRGLTRSGLPRFASLWRVREAGW